MSPRSNTAVRADQLAARCAAAATTAPVAPSAHPFEMSDQPCDVCRLPLPAIEIELGESTHASCCLPGRDGASTTSTRRTTR